MTSYDEVWENIAQQAREDTKENNRFYKEIIEEIKWQIETHLNFCCRELKNGEKWKITEEELENYLNILNINLKNVDKAEIQRAYEIVLRNEVNIWFSATLMYIILCKLTNRQP